MMDMIRTLSFKDKESLFIQLGKDLQVARAQNKMDADNMDMAEMTKKVCGIMGIDKYDHVCRERRNVIAGIIIANGLSWQGKSEMVVGQLMGKSHSTVHYYKTILKTWSEYPRIYADELSYWNQLKQIIWN